MSEPATDGAAMIARCAQGQLAGDEYRAPALVLTSAEWREVCGHGEETLAVPPPDPIPMEPMGAEVPK